MSDSCGEGDRVGYGQMSSDVRKMRRFDYPSRAFDDSAPCSSAVTRASMSSISIDLAACVSTLSAALTRVDAGVLRSTITFSNVETAALAACCKRATDCPKAAQRAWR